MTITYALSVVLSLLLFHQLYILACIRTWRGYVDFWKDEMMTLKTIDNHPKLLFAVSMAMGCLMSAGILYLLPWQLSVPLFCLGEVVSILLLKKSSGIFLWHQNKYNTQ